MKCPHCGFENIESSKHCLNCGSRLDGNIICPRCNEAISPDFDRCPHCKRKIPHEHIEQNPIETTRKERVGSIFNKIFLIVIIASLATAMGFVWSPFIVTPDGTSIGGIYYFYQMWKDLFNELSLSSDLSFKTAIYLKYIPQFVLMCLNILATYIFGIIGILSSAFSLKKRGLKECNSYIYLAIVSTSNLMTLSYLSSLYGITPGRDVLYSNQFVSFYSYIFAMMFLMVIFSIVIRHQSGKKALTFEKIVFCVNVGLASVMIPVLGSYILYSKDGGVSYRNIALFIDLLSQSSEIAKSSEGLSLILLSGASAIIGILECASLCVLIVFFAQGFFTEKEYSVKFKIPCYAFSFITFVLSVIELALAGATTYFFGKYFGCSPIIGELSLVNIVLGLLLFGASIGSLNIARSYRHNQRLAQETTKK